MSSFGIPILMYHNTHPTPELNSVYTIPLSIFEKQMTFLQEANCNTLLVSELTRLKKLKSNYVSITFDDGYIENYLYVLPILKKVGFRATFFVIINKINTPGYMSWDNLAELTDNGMEIGSHTLSHRPLHTLDKRSVLEELKSSKSLMEAKFEREVLFLSFPQGSFNRRILALANEVGYKGCCTSQFGYHRPNNDAYRLKRIDIKGTYDLKRFQQIVMKKRTCILSLYIIQFLKGIMKKGLNVVTRKSG